jgi:integrase
MTTRKIKVWVIDQKREFYYLQWIDPSTGRRVSRSSKTKSIREAHKLAGELESKLNAKQTTAGSMLFRDFVDIYTEEHLMSLAASSMMKSLSVLNLIEVEMNPETLNDITSQQLSLFCARGRSGRFKQPENAKKRPKPRSEATIAAQMKTLKAALSWAVTQGYLDAVPTFPKQTRARVQRAKGRPITNEEFVKMLRGTASVVGIPAARSWRRLLIGLWLSGLRLEEALALRWNDENAALSLDTSRDMPLLVIRQQKSNREQICPLTKDFGTWVMKQRLRDSTIVESGWVFPLKKHRYLDIRNVNATSKTISEIGKAAGVKVSETKYASAHDLRRSFGLRWSSQLMPAELMLLMRHADISTTMKYYAVQSAQTFAERLWKE